MARWGRGDGHDLGVDVDQNLNVPTLLPDLGNPDTTRGEDGSDQTPEDGGRRAPLANNLAGDERVLGSPLGVLDGLGSLINLSAEHLGTGGRVLGRDSPHLAVGVAASENGCTRTRNAVLAAGHVGQQ